MSGHKPPAAAVRPTRESFHLTTAKIGYVTDQLTIEEFEESVWHVLTGGTLDEHGRVPKSIELQPGIIEFGGRQYYKGAPDETPFTEPTMMKVAKG